MNIYEKYYDTNINVQMFPDVTARWLHEDSAGLCQLSGIRSEQTGVCGHEDTSTNGTLAR